MKRFLFILSVLFLGSMLFAEPAAVGITDSDVSNFIKNYSIIQKSVNSNTTETQLNAILLKNGISGDNRIEKYSVIGQGIAVVAAESEMDADSLAMLDSLGVNPLKNLYDRINSKDLAVIRKYSKQLIALANEEDIEDIPVTTPKARNNTSVLSEDARKKLLAQQEEAFQQQKQEKQKLENSKKKTPLEGSKYLSTVEKKIKDSKKTEDCGFLYTKYDSKNVSYYKKETGKIPPFSVNKAWYTNSAETEQEALFSISSSEIELTYLNNNGEKVTKEIDFTITSSEFYIPKKSGKEKYNSKGVGGEIILKTKEAGTIHIWYNDNQYSNKQQVKVWIEALGEVDFHEIVFYGG